MKEWKASEKEAQKMTRDGAISVNMVTGETSHVSDRAPEQDYSPPAIPRRWRVLPSTNWMTGASGSLRRKSGGTAAKPTRRIRRPMTTHPPVCSFQARNAPRRSCKRRSANPTRHQTSWTRYGRRPRKAALAPSAGESADAAVTGDRPRRPCEGA